MSVSMLHVHVHAVRPCPYWMPMSLSMLHVHVHAACSCLCCMSMSQSMFMLRVYPSLHTSTVRLWRACNLTSFSQCLTGPVDYLFASHHKGPGFKSPGGFLCETGIFLLALSRYIDDPDVFRSLASSPFRCFTRLRTDNV
jgi:hypothetical protein